MNSTSKLSGSGGGLLIRDTLNTNVSVSLLHAVIHANTVTGNNWASGGGLYIQSGNLHLLNSSLDRNTAKQGRELRIDMPTISDGRGLRVFIMSTWIGVDGDDKDVYLGGFQANMFNCERYPCAAGQSCTFINYSLWPCKPCTKDTQSQGITCKTCQNHFHPAKNLSACEPCPNQTVGAFSRRDLIR